jgi:small-conductance mechanosensitive channel
VRLGVVDEGHHTRMEELNARLEASRAVLEKIEALDEDGQISPRTRERLRDLYQERVERYEAGLEAGRVTEEYEESSAAWSRWRRKLFEAERAAILSLRDEGKISAEVMRRIERDIDLEELRFSG